ncbi:putative inorganic phosphate cotransporter [Centruroides vittatus]|uniref:putative inorganic phosphate cotransporter n=1 Tax=Centruroides vittatus TaxID=120091 RepID=UPI0035102E8B
MVNHSAISSIYNTTTSKQCPEMSQQNSTSSDKESSYVWSQPTQGIILGSAILWCRIFRTRWRDHYFLFGPKKMLIISSLISSIFSILTPFCADVGVSVISLCQAIFGFGQGLVLYGSLTLLGKWSPENEKSTLSSISFSGMQVGTFIGLITTGYICEDIGWPFNFYTFGICGIVLSLCVMFTVYDRPQEHPRISDKELTFLNESVTNIASGETKLNILWKQILTSRAVLILTMTKICLVFGYFIILTKIPSYLEIILRFPIQKNGIMSALIVSVDCIAIFISGFIADYMKSRKYLSITNIKKICEAIATFGPALGILAISFQGCESTNVIICLMVGMGCFGFLAPEFAGVIFGLTDSLYNAAGIFSPYVAGVILDENVRDMIRWSYVFYMVSSAYILGGVIFIFGATAKVQPWASTNTDNKKQDNN